MAVYPCNGLKPLRQIYGRSVRDFGPLPPPPPPVYKECIRSNSTANTRHWTNVGSMLGRRRRRRANIDPTLVQSLVFAGRVLPSKNHIFPKVVLIMVQRLKRWVIIDTTLGQRLEFAGNLLKPDDRTFCWTPRFFRLVLWFTAPSS